jgi:hypothetical protein
MLGVCGLALKTLAMGKYLATRLLDPPTIAYLPTSTIRHPEIF